MTIVELYDDKPINNIVGVLAFNPDKVIYVGGYSKKQFDSKKLPILKNYYECKGGHLLQSSMSTSNVIVSLI